MGNEYSVIYSRGPAVREKIRFAFFTGKYYAAAIRLCHEGLGSSDNKSVAGFAIWWNRSRVGFGDCISGQGSTGGLAILAQIIQKYTGFSLSLCVMLMDGTVITLAGFALSPERALYALIGLFVTGKVIDAVEMGLSYSKVAYIISIRKKRSRRLFCRIWTED